jgi:hypothetical protein
VNFPYFIVSDLLSLGIAEWPVGSFQCDAVAFVPLYLDLTGYVSRNPCSALWQFPHRRRFLLTALDQFRDGSRAPADTIAKPPEAVRRRWDEIL